MTLYVRKVISTLQGGVNVDLGPKTLIVGPNASGKTACTRSIELALTGTASDIQGRDEVAKVNDLLSLATGDKDLVTTAFLSDGTEAKFEVKRKPGKKGAVSASAQPPLRPPSIDPERVLPLRTLRENVLGKPDTARRFFLGYSIREITQKDILDRLPGSLHALYQQAAIAACGNLTLPEIDKLLRVQQWADAKAGATTREANAAARATNEMGQGLPPPPTEAEYNEAKEQLALAKLTLEKAVAQYQAQSQRDALNERIAALSAQGAVQQKRLQDAQARLGYIEQEAAKLEPIPPEPQPLTAGQLAVIDAVLYHAEIKAPQCFCCRTSIPPEEWPSRAELAKRTRIDAEASVLAQAERRQKIIAQHQRKDELLASARFDVEQAQSELKSLDATLREITAVANGSQNGVEVVHVTIGDARATVDSVEGKLRAMDRARAAWESARKSRDAAADAESESAKWGQLSQACSNVVRQLLDYGVQGFCVRVQAYLPQTDRFGLRLHDVSEREVCQFGLYKGEQLFVALSGAEWARVTAALAAVCGPTAEDQLAVIKPEERAFDPDTLTEVLRSFIRVPQQVIIESPIMPTVVPQGWTVVATGPQKPKKVVVEPAERQTPSDPLFR